MTVFEYGDTVVFRQVAASGPADEIELPVYIEDGTAYQCHRGTVRDPNVGEPTVTVSWEDGKRTKTQCNKLSRPEETDWAEEVFDL